MRYHVCDLIASCDGSLFKSVSQLSHCLSQLLSKKLLNIALRSESTVTSSLHVLLSVIKLINKSLFIQ